MKQIVRSGLATAAVTASMLAIPAASHAAPLRGDFDGDGRSDLAIGAPGEDLTFELAADAGVVHVLYGSATGLRSDVAQVLDQGGGPGETAIESGDAFGRALAAGDFDGDGYDDLAVGSPYETIGAGSAAKANAGMVQIYSGTRHGLKAKSTLTLTEADFGTPAEASDYFGSVLTAGNIGRGPQDDLAIGTPNETIEAAGADEGGAVQLIYGGPGGLRTQTAANLDQADVGQVPEFRDHFGGALAIGNFGGGATGDLAVGSSGEGIDVGGSDIAVAGIVNVLYGRQSGIDGAHRRLLSQATAGVPGVPMPGDRFGNALAAGNFGRDSRDDLAIGVYGDGDAADPVNDAPGAVNVLYGARTGLQVKNGQIWSQASKAVKGSAGISDQFGSALAVGDLGRDRRDDLAIGAIGDLVGPGAIQGGSVNILFGGKPGLTAKGNQIWSQASGGIADEPEAGDHFGGFLSIGDFGRSRKADLAIGVNEKLAATSPEGAVETLYSQANGPAALHSRLWTQNSAGLGEQAEDGDAFGSALAP